MSYADWAESNAVVGVVLGVTESFGVIGLVVFTICQTNFLPFLRHLREVVPDFAKDPTLRQADPGVIAP